MNYKIKRLQHSNLNDVKNLVRMFSRVFENKVIELKDLPGDAYLQSLLERPDVYALAALDGENVIGGLTAYELPLITKNEKELYIYDLAVDENYRRQGVASSLAGEIKAFARERQISSIFVEAESEDSEAVDFYRSLGAEQIKVDHFNIRVD